MLLVTGHLIGWKLGSCAGHFHEDHQITSQQSDTSRVVCWLHMVAHEIRLLRPACLHGYSATLCTSDRLLAEMYEASCALVSAPVACSLELEMQRTDTI